ncbi:hypothetical protein ES705_42441 [subsurface metagenome]
MKISISILFLVILMSERIDKLLFKPVDHVVYLDVFYDRIITELAKNHNSSVSETLKHIKINWVNEHHDFLKNDHGINFKEIMDNIQKEKLTWKRMIGK